jgi:transposase InsO family protein
VALRFSGHFDLALDALKEASCQRLGNRSREARLAHRGDRGERYLSIRYTDDLRDSGIDGSVDSRGDSCDNTFAKSVIGLFKPEVIPSVGGGAASRTSTLTRCSGSGGSTTSDCWDGSTIYPRPSLTSIRRMTTPPAIHVDEAVLT